MVTYTFGQSKKLRNFLNIILQLFEVNILSTYDSKIEKLEKAIVQTWLCKCHGDQQIRFKRGFMTKVIWK